VDRASDTAVKGCLIFIAVFVFGVALMAAGLVQDLMVDGFGVQLSKAPSDNPRSLARIFEVCGLVVAFGAIYGAAAWRFFKQRNAQKNQPQNK
jgi:hypothetical protein